jgi:hypothetical protein
MPPVETGGLNDCVLYEYKRLKPIYPYKSILVV